MAFFIKKGFRCIRYEWQAWNNFCGGQIAHNFYSYGTKAIPFRAPTKWEIVHEGDTFLEGFARSFIGLEGRTGVCLFADAFGGYLDSTMFQEKMDSFTIIDNNTDFCVTPVLSDWFRNSNSHNMVRWLSLTITNDEFAEREEEDDE